jgi:hypothetical protein
VRLSPPRLPAPKAAARADRARRMRIVATALLVAMAAVFVVAHKFAHLHPALGYLIAFSEAAMVGGLADWFAVTALFRHPLGIPIPHTAIIPEKKDRIADTMAGFLRDNFLTPSVVARRMRGMNLARAAGDFLAEPRPGGQSRIREGAADCSPSCSNRSIPSGSATRSGPASRASSSGSRSRRCSAARSARRSPTGATARCSNR